MTTVDIDALEEKLVKALRNFKQNAKYKNMAEQIFYTDARSNRSQLTSIFGNAADHKYLLDGLQTLAENAKIISDAKGDACLPETKEFIANLKTLSHKHYNNLLEFTARTVLKDSIDDLHKPNPFG